MTLAIENPLNTQLSFWWGSILSKEQTSASFILIESIVLILWKKNICRVRSLSHGKLGYTPNLAEVNDNLIVHFNVTI